MEVRMKRVASENDMNANRIFVWMLKTWNTC